MALLAHFQLTSGRIESPIGAIYRGKYADYLQLGQGLGLLMFKAGDANGMRACANPAAAQQRLSN